MWRVIQEAMCHICGAAAGHLPQDILLMCADAQPGYHRDLLDSYTNKGAVALRNVEDDGYIVQVREAQGAN